MYNLQIRIWILILALLITQNIACRWGHGKTWTPKTMTNIEGNQEERSHEEEEENEKYASITLLIFQAADRVDGEKVN